MYKSPAYRHNKHEQAERVLGKNLPCSQEAERAVLSALLLNTTSLQSVTDLLRPEDFYIAAHRAIYQAMLDIVASQKAIDLVTLQDQLEKTEQLERAGGLVNLISLQEDIPALGLIVQHAHIIKEKALLRELISCATTIITNAYAQDDRELEAVLDEAEKTIFSISHKRISQQFIQLNIWIKKTFEQLSEMRSSEKGVTGVASGYKKLDEMTSGFQQGDLVVLAARPSMGKTALALNIALQVAESARSVGFFSLEMAAEQLALRLVSMKSGIAHHKIRNATLSSEEWYHVTNGAAYLGELKIFIDEAPLQSIMDIRSKARKLKAEQELDIVIVDYLQLISTTRRYENRQQEVSEVSRSLKALAKELAIPVLALSQLSRAVESRTDKRPLLSDLRESGAIEQDADLIMFLYRDSVYNKNAENAQETELIVSKQRNGPTGLVNLNFIKEHGRFEDAWE